MSSLTFINSTFLGFLIPFFFLPILIHLLNKKFPKTINFSSIYFIKEALRRKSQIFRLRDWLITIFRILILTVFILIFTKPNIDIFGTVSAGTKKREMMILFDNSLSMQYEQNGISFFNKGVIEIEKLLATASGPDLVNIINVTHSPQPFENASTQQVSSLKSKIRLLQPKNSTADFEGSINWALTHFQQTSNQKELYIVSDFQRQTWSKVKLPQFDGKVYYINVGHENGNNTSITNATLDNTNLLKNEDIYLEATIGNFSSLEKTLPVSIQINDIKISTEDVTLKPWSSNQKSFVFRIDKFGEFRGAISIPNDHLNLDNKCYFTLSIKEKEKILILSDETENQNSSAFFITKALNPYGKNEGKYQTEIKSLDQFNSIQLVGVDKIFISKINKLNEENISVIKQFLSNGGSIVYFLDGTFEPENLKSLEIAFDNSPLPARISAKQIGSKQGFGARKFMKGDFKSPFLKIFDGLNREKLSHLKFYDYYLSAVNDEKGVLLYFDDNSPALFREIYGQGRILFFNISANELDSNIARQDVFPVWMQEIARHLKPSYGKTNDFELYQTALIQVDPKKPKDNQVIGPEGNEILDLNLVSINHSKMKIKLEKPGVYRVVQPNKEELLSVNITKLESDIRSVDLNRFAQTTANNTPLNIIEGSDKYKAIKEGVPLFHYIAIALLVMLITEASLQLFFKSKT
jgi:hypothetical protein